MYEIKNRTKSPAQVMVRSKKKPNSFTTLIIPGVGKGCNYRLVEDELMTENVKDIEKLGIISIRYIPNNKAGN